MSVVEVLQHLNPSKLLISNNWDNNLGECRREKLKWLGLGPVGATLLELRKGDHRFIIPSYWVPHIKKNLHGYQKELVDLPYKKDSV